MTLLEYSYLNLVAEKRAMHFRNIKVIKKMIIVRRKKPTST